MKKNKKYDQKNYQAAAGNITLRYKPVCAKKLKQC